MKVVFKTDPDLSAIHAAAVLGSGLPTIDDKLATALGRPVRQINDRLELADLDAPQFWRTMVACKAGTDGERVGNALLDAGCSELAVDSISPAILGRLTDIRVAVKDRFPKLADQLPLRAGPLRGLWEANGPGLMRQIGAQTVATMIPSRIHLMLVQPIRGGDGGLLWDTDRVWIEAVLSHPDASLPETLRIAWLVARKGAESLESNRWVSKERLPIVIAHALVPMVLTAGQALDICQCDDHHIDAAVRLWHLADGCDPLIRWWSQLRESKIPLPVALKALDKML
jgi:hypothetical protein